MIYQWIVISIKSFNDLNGFQAAHHAAGNQAIVVVADDTDVFALLLHYRHSGMINGSNVYMQSPLRGRAVIDIDATVRNNMSIIPVLLAAHALSGCDVVASYFNVGKGVVLKVLRAGMQIQYSIESSQLQLWVLQCIIINR
jgi:hypothetical protein